MKMTGDQIPIYKKLASHKWEQDSPSMGNNYSLRTKSLSIAKRCRDGLEDQLLIVGSHPTTGKDNAEMGNQIPIVVLHPMIRNNGAGMGWVTKYSGGIDI